MKKICAIQMDPLESMQLLYDSSFAIGVEAQKRGYQIFHYLPQNLSYQHDHRKKNGRIMARGQFVKLHGDTPPNQNDPTTAGADFRTDHFSILESVDRLYLDECEVVFIRQDPPFDMAYITGCHLLEILQDTSQTLVCNNPLYVRSSPEKLAVLEFSDLMPATLISKNLDEIKKFHAQTGDMVLKPLYSKGGHGVVFIGKGDRNAPAYLEIMGETNQNLPLIAQEFLPNVKNGDKRILFVDGEPLGYFNRTPQKGEVRSNTYAGGGIEATTLTASDQKIIEKVQAWIKERDLFLVGIDVIDGYLTEINVTSPTGIPTCHRLQKNNLVEVFWDKLEQKIADKKKT